MTHPSVCDNKKQDIARNKISQESPDTSLINRIRWAYVLAKLTFMATCMHGMYIKLESIEAS